MGWTNTPRRGRTYRYRPLRRSMLPVRVAQEVAYRRRLYLAGWIHATAAALAVVAVLVVSGWIRWPIAALVASAPLLVSLATSFGPQQRRGTVASIRDVAMPRRAMARREAWIDAALASPPFPVYGSTTHDIPLLAGWSGGEGSDLASVALTYGDRADPTVPFLAVETRVGTTPDHVRFEATMNLRTLLATPPDVSGLDRHDVAEALHRHHTAMMSAPDPPWTPGALIVGGEAVPVELAAVEPGWVAIGSLDPVTVVVVARAIEPDAVTLDVVDPSAARRPF